MSEYGLVFKILTPFDCSSGLTSREIGNIHSYKFSGTVEPQDTEDEDEGDSPRNEVSWLGRDWALIEISDPKLYLPNSFLAGSSTRLIQVSGHLRNDNLVAGKVSILSANGVVNGILNGSEASLMIGNSYFTVRSIALEVQLGKSPEVLNLRVVDLANSSGWRLRIMGN
jgi:hypothetical protein